MPRPPPFVRSLVSKGGNAEDRRAGTPQWTTLAAQLPKQSEIFDDDEIAIAEQLIERMTDHFTPEKYQDTYRESLLALIEKRRESTRLRLRPQLQPKPTEDGDLVETLKASIDRIAGKRRRLAA